jgi:DNA-binding PadR family transcriptional regulator
LGVDRCIVSLVNIFRRNATSDGAGPLTAIEFDILLSLAEGDRHGYAIIQDIAARSKGTVTARPGTLYRAVSRLLQSGLIEEVEGSTRRSGPGSDERRRYYSLTTRGRRMAEVEAQRLARQVRAARTRKLLKSGT